MKFSYCVFIFFGLFISFLFCFFFFYMFCFFFFFFQAEDGIRDTSVTGVQTCALPIFDWLETSDEFAGGDTLDPKFVETFLKMIDCYVMGSRTYETALNFEAKGFGWANGDKSTFDLTSRELTLTRNTVEFYSVDMAQFVNERLSLSFSVIRFVRSG